VVDVLSAAVSSQSMVTRGTKRGRFLRNDNPQARNSDDQASARIWSKTLRRRSSVQFESEAEFCRTGVNL
jgi:hypothetical protein